MALPTMEQGNLQEIGSLGCNDAVTQCALNNGNRCGFDLNGGDVDDDFQLVDGIFDTMLDGKSPDLPSTASGDDVEGALGGPPLPKWCELAFQGGSKRHTNHDRLSETSVASSGWQSSTFSSASFLDTEIPPNVIVGTRVQPRAVLLSQLSLCTRLPDGHFMSLGSRLHSTGDCTPCKFFRGARGCRDQALCQLCHYPHKELTRSGVRRAQKRSSIEKRKLFEENATQLIPAPVAPGREPPRGTPLAPLSQAPPQVLPRAFSCHELGLVSPGSSLDLPAGSHEEPVRWQLLHL